jgi:hypothetical protein
MKRTVVVLAAIATAGGIMAAPASALTVGTPSKGTLVSAVGAAAPSITMRVPARVEAGRVLTVSGVARPARASARVQLWELRNRQWVAIAESAQAKDGTFTVRMRAGHLGRHTYRVATQDSEGTFSVWSPGAGVTTVRQSTPGVRSTRLAATTPLGGGVGQSNDGPLYVTGTFSINGRRYPNSVRTVSGHFSYELGAAAATFGAAIALAPVRRGHHVHRGPRLVEIRVDDVVRVRQFLRDGQAFPVRLDVRGKRVVHIKSTYYGSHIVFDPGSDVLLGTPVVTSQVWSERGAMTETALSNLRPVAVEGAVKFDHVVGSNQQELLGGTMWIQGPSRGTTTGSVTYAVNGRYRRLVAVPGIFGETVPTLTGRVRLTGDGRLLADLPALIRSYRRSTVNVTGVRRLRIDLVATHDSEVGTVYAWDFVLGDPRLS